MTAAPAPSVEGLLERAARLERELLELERQLVGAGVRTPRAGLHLVVEAGGERALIEARTVLQVTRLVEFTPISGAPPAVLGGFVRHGQPGVAVDLARLMGVVREPDVDAHLVIAGGARMLGVLVDRVRNVVDAPPRIDPRAERLLPAFRAELVAAWCEVGGWLLPVVTLDAIERLTTELDAGGEAPRSPAVQGERT